MDSVVSPIVVWWQLCARVATGRVITSLAVGRSKHICSIFKLLS